VIQFSVDLANRLNINGTKEVTLCVGVKKEKVGIEIDSTLGKNFLIRPESITEVFLNRARQPLAFFPVDTENELKVGPVLGVLSGIPPFMLGEDIVSLYESIAENALERGMICFFLTPDLINFKKETVTGFKYSQKNWTAEEHPMPDIIYNQTGYISEELRPFYSRLFLDYLKKNENIKLINPFLALRNKMQNHYELSNHTAVANYLPDTQNCNSPEIIFDFLERYESVYLKPITSSLGMGVYKLSVYGSKEYTVEHHLSHSEKIKETIKNKAELTKVIKEIIMRQPYLVQQTVKLIHYQNKPVDFRIHLFKNMYGEWDIIVINARVGPVGGIITGRNWGGCRFPAGEVLSDLFTPDQAERILDKMKDAVIKIAQAIDELHEKPFGELGFDIAVDEKKEIWMIEVNPKPNWSLPTGIDENPVKEKMAEDLLGYCRWLHNLGEPVIVFP
jgi:glutathione synthase/RimK-type ligase-like ATP-grasp enzyme